MKSIVAVEDLSGYRLRLEFNDGISGEVDLSDMVGKGVFERWRDYSNFEKAHAEDDGELAFDDDIDLCPDSLYVEIAGTPLGEIHQGVTEPSARA